MNKLVASFAPTLVNASKPMAVRAFCQASVNFLDKAEVQERVLTVVKTFDSVDAAKVTPTAHFINDLGLDSLDTVELVMAMEEEFCVEIPDAEAERISSALDAVEYLAAHPQAK